jgi:CDP-diacylglycerol--serine O-phosphatidyltransferase
MRVVDPPQSPPRPRRRPRILAIQVLPTLVTLGNVLAGLLAISYVVDAWGQPADSAARSALWTKAAWVIFIGMFCDALDGKVARLTGSASAFGAELDSLADVVTFGVAPALLAKTVVLDHLTWVNPRLAQALAAVYVLGAALRLARYNVESQRIVAPGHVTRVFRGLPSPGAAGVLASLVLLRNEYDFPAVEHALLVGLPALGILMVSRFGFAHLMNRTLAGARSPIAVVLLLVVVALIVEFPEASLASLFVGYALSGPITFLMRLIVGRPRWAVEEDEDEEEEPASVGGPDDGAPLP